MKQRPLLYLLLILFVAIGLLSSCDDIIEPSINKSQVQLEAPADQYQSTSYTINFWWDQVNHALTYHLQVVTPNFASPGSLVLDTIVSNYKFSFTLNPGNYQWRVMAENGSSQTVFTAPRSFTVVASSIKQQSVQLTAPSNNFLTNQSPYIFQWGSLYGANAYQFEIDTNNFANPNTILLNQVIPGQQISFTFPKDQVYQWRVRAQNDTAQAQWSVVYLITYDHTPPGQVTLVAPVNAATVSLPVSLQWNAVASAVKYKLYVYQSDGITIYNSNFPMALNATSYTFNLGSSGNKIYWMVTALDAAGNESQGSALKQFCFAVKHYTMVKNKKLTYFLGLVVLVVWAMIIYRIFDAAGGGDDDSVQAITAKTTREAYNDFAIPKDTTHLLLNYRDPFGLIKQKDTTNLNVKRSFHRSTISMTQKPTFNWGFIQYSGYIRNPVSKKLITLVSINGKNAMLSEGESRDQVKLIKNLRDSIKISFNGKTKFIAIKSAAL